MSEIGRTERRARLLIGLLSAGVLLVVGVLLLGPRGPGDGSLDVSSLPAVNATLNAATAAVLVTGYVLVRRRRLRAHRVAMTAALGLSTAFLVSYVVYHGVAGSVRFPWPGAIRVVYLALLVSHIVLAAVIVPLALTTVWRAWSGRFDRHRRIARWTLPIWLYVSVSGVLVYWMLYHLAGAR